MARQYRPSKNDIRSRAVDYARSCDMSEDILVSIEAVVNVGSSKSTYEFCPITLHPTAREPTDFLINADNMPRLRIGIDNMVASAFEIGYQAAVDDRMPARPLRGTVSKVTKVAKRRR